MNTSIRLLTHNDWIIWKEIRLEALRKNPEAFGGSFEEESLHTDQQFQEDLVHSDIFGSFVNNKLIGCIGFFALSSKKKQHIGKIFTFYTKPAYRGQGVGNMLLKQVIVHAKKKVLQLNLSVITNNASAISLYIKHGFIRYGTEPRALRLDVTFYDEHLMILRFD